MGAIIFQLNNMEIVFFSIYFLAIFMLSKIKHVFLKFFLGKYTFIVIIAVLFILFSIIYLLMSGTFYIIFVPYLVIMGLLSKILYEDRKSFNIL